MNPEFDTTRIAATGVGSLNGPRMETHARGPLRDEELDELLSMLHRECALDIVNERAQSILASRNALTQWEERGRARGGRPLFVGNYRIFDSIAQGETYDVLKAQHLFTGRADAIKVLRPVVLNDQSRSRHLHKLRWLSSLECPRFVHVYEAGHTRAVDFVAVELAAGSDLRQHVRRHGNMHMSAAAHVVAQAAMAVDALHSLGLVHGCLESTKIIIDESMDIKLCDAGLGCIQGEPMIANAASGRAVDFLAPEAVVGERICAASDVYSLGCVLYYAVTGKVPFPGGSESEKRTAHLSHYPLDPRRLAANLDDAFVDIMAEMMKKESDKRPASMGEVAARLKQWTGRGDK
ncbi:MAG: serine/threonine-protein kinase [Pirellulales bacterium]